MSFQIHLSQRQCVDNNILFTCSYYHIIMWQPSLSAGSGGLRVWFWSPVQVKQVWLSSSLLTSLFQGLITFAFIFFCCICFSGASHTFISFVRETFKTICALCPSLKPAGDNGHPKQVLRPPSGKPVSYKRHPPCWWIWHWCNCSEHTKERYQHAVNNLSSIHWLHMNRKTRRDLSVWSGI